METRTINVEIDTRVLLQQIAALTAVGRQRLVEALRRGEEPFLTRLIVNDGETMTIAITLDLVKINRSDFSLSRMWSCP